MMADALLLLRSAIAANSTPTLTTSAEPTADSSQTTTDLAQATHIQFNHTSKRDVLPLATATRFQQEDKPVDLRSVFFAWQTKDLTVPEYLSGLQTIRDALQAAGKDSAVQQLVFAEKIDLITWLDSLSDESEHIRPLNEEEQAKQAHLAAQVARGPVSAPAVDAAGVGRGHLDPRLREILNGERRTGDRNSVLRGVKPTDFSHVRKHCETIIQRGRAKPGQAASGVSSAAAGAAAATGQTGQRKGNRRVEPIILLSPSASSLLRMSNIKAFLDDGTYISPEQAGNDANRLLISRKIPSIDPNRPLRFVLVDSTEMFKPEYWSRVAAVFTTGQAWQFKSYKWQAPADLFAHTQGIFVGWNGDDVPSAIRDWGRGVAAFRIDRPNPGDSTQSRWRDREIVENIWRQIEESMRIKGMNKDGMLTGGR